MSTQHREDLSALIDGELDAQPSRFALKRVEHDAELRGCWSRYHLIGAAMRRTDTLVLRADLVERVSAGIADAAVPRRGAGAAVLRWAAGGAIAASVAVVALVAMRPDASTETGGEPLVASAPQATPATGQVPVVPLRATDLQPDMNGAAQTVAATEGQPLGPAVLVDPRIESYLIRHNQALSAQGRAGFVSYVPVVASPQPAGTVRTADGRR